MNLVPPSFSSNKAPPWILTTHISQPAKSEDDSIWRDWIIKEKLDWPKEIMFAHFTHGLQNILSKDIFTWFWWWRRYGCQDEYHCVKIMFKMKGRLRWCQRLMLCHPDLYRGRIVTQILPYYYASRDWSYHVFEDVSHAVWRCQESWSQKWEKKRKGLTDGLIIQLLTLLWRLWYYLRLHSFDKSQDSRLIAASFSDESKVFVFWFPPTHPVVSSFYFMWKMNL
jgi:hypothetical protein